MIKMAYQTGIRTLADAVTTVPNFGGRLFRFNSLASDGTIDNRGSLTAPQKLYLKSLQDLDDPSSPSGCKAVILARANS